ncbi:MAG: DNA repair exonuclease [Hyphomicrobiaceae bacterium]|nr:DNA repair exonuclease [Hyphomicrobiaceae bacterium]
MAFRFIHTADWQIAKPFTRFPSELAGELAAARLSVVARIAEIARRHGAAHVVVAGDVFDNDRLDAPTLRRAMEHMRGQSDIAFVLLPGNHDPAKAGGVWERIARLGMPSNVTVLNEPHPHSLTPECVVLPAPLTSKSPGRDPTEWMTDAPTEPGQIRIGLAHGSIQGFSGDGESSVPLAPDRAARARLDYLALGDWHGTTRVDARTWYAGTPEPDRFPDNDPGNVLAVTIEGAGATPQVESVRSAQFTWVKRECMLSDVSDVASLDSIVSGLGPTLTSMLLRLRVNGSLTLAGEAALRQWRESLEGRLRYLELDDSALVLRTSSDDLSIAGEDGALRACASELVTISNDAARSDRDAAKRALQMLYAFAAKARQEGT